MADTDTNTSNTHTTPTSLDETFVAGLGITVSHIFIIPYRNREAQREKFVNHMPSVLDTQIGTGTWKIWIIEQNDDKLFNRGALLNIGFRIAQTRYPDTWQQIQFIFHDIDIMPNGPNIIDYNTTPGKVRHPYGDSRPQWGGILGCLCIIYGADYALVGGSPNYYGWGGEDVALSFRCQANSIHIDESNFILRRSTDTIIDPESNTTPTQRALCIACDKKNLGRVFSENRHSPTNNYKTLDYTISQEYSVRSTHNPTTEHEYLGNPANITQFICTFDVTGL